MSKKWCFLSNSTAHHGFLHGCFKCGMGLPNLGEGHKAKDRSHLLIVPVHIMEHLNSIADSFSQSCSVPTEWSLDHTLFWFLFLSFPSLQMDLFGTCLNSQPWVLISPMLDCLVLVSGLEKVGLNLHISACRFSSSSIYKTKTFQGLWSSISPRMEELFLIFSPFLPLQKKYYLTSPMISQKIKGKPF